MSIERRIDSGTTSPEDEVDRLVEGGVFSPDEARRMVEAAVDATPEKAKPAPAVSLLGAKTVEVTARVPRSKSPTEFPSPADWKPTSHGAATGAQHGDSEVDGGVPEYFRPYNRKQVDQAAENVRRGREVVAPVLEKINRRVEDRKLREARGL